MNIIKALHDTDDRVRLVAVQKLAEESYNNYALETKWNLVKVCISERITEIR